MGDPIGPANLKTVWLQTQSVWLRVTQISHKSLCDNCRKLTELLVRHDSLMCHDDTSFTDTLWNLLLHAMIANHHDSMTLSGLARSCTVLEKVS